MQAAWPCEPVIILESDHSPFYSAAPELARALLTLVGYSGAETRLASTLSHVDRRLIEIARALGTAPAVMRPTALMLNLLVATIGTVQFAGSSMLIWSALWRGKLKYKG